MVMCLTFNSFVDKKYKYDRVSLRLGQRAKVLADTFHLCDIDGVEKASEVRLYYKDLGPQPGVGVNVMSPMTKDLGLRQIACICYVGHFAKRLLETRFVHRFSHATMPVSSLRRNCLYYWLFALVIAYFTNHPLYKFPTFGWPQVYVGLGLFLIGELGNFSCHLALRNLRPAGTTVRQFPRPVPRSPLTFLFKYVACPNYTYETISWIGFSLMTQTLPAVAFTAIGFWTMAQWARNKLRDYRKEFPSFTRGLRAIVPFVY
uniref:S5A_REDUCTASE domain-containing protein n=1 Tax=Mesocestoides corti TaxID=53468 RepID=A0A5K3FSD2_MESCO